MFSSLLGSDLQGTAVARWLPAELSQSHFYSNVQTITHEAMPQLIERVLSMLGDVENVDSRLGATEILHGSKYHSFVNHEMKLM